MGKAGITASRADGLQAGNLFMSSDDKNKASFKEVALRSAKITGSIDMSGASFDGTLDADALQVGGMLLMGDALHQLGPHDFLSCRQQP